MARRTGGGAKAECLGVLYDRSTCVYFLGYHHLRINKYHELRYPVRMMNQIFLQARIAMMLE